MDTISIVILGIVFVLLLVVVWYVTRRFGQRQGNEERASLRTKLEERVHVLDENRTKIAQQATHIEEIVRERQRLLVDNSRLEAILGAERRATHEKLALLEEAKQTMSAHFKNLAGDIFDNRNKQFSDQNRTSLEQFLKPFREQIDNFQRDVKSTTEQAIRERSSLRTHLEQLEKLNHRLGDEANNLTSALKGESQTRGAWGELTLKRTLEMSGLQEGREYITQVTMTSDDERKQRPDCIIILPEGRNIIIDSKVSLVAYSKLTAVEDKEQHIAYMKQHLESIRRHIKSLENSQYQQLSEINSLEFVLMFIPIEGALWTALQHDDSLFEEAFRKRIVLVSPSTLLIVLRTVEQLWKIENQNRNSRKIAELAGKMYDKFAGFVETMQEVGAGITKSQRSYDKAINQLSDGRGNLIGRANALKNLGLNTAKSLPDVDAPMSDEQIAEDSP